MKIKIQVEFEVNTDNENIALGAASMAAWNHLCLSMWGQALADEVVVFVDGFGEFTVKMGEDHD